MWIRFGVLILWLISASVSHAQTTISAGKLQAVLSPEQGITELKLNGKTVFTGTSTHVKGSLFTLLRNVPTVFKFVHCMHFFPSQ